MISDTPEKLLDLRLNDSPVTLKEAGYRDMFGSFVEDFFSRGWEGSVRSIDLFEKNASGDEYIVGQAEAVNDVLKMNEDPYTRGCFKMLKVAYDHLNSGKEIPEFDESMEGDPKEVEGFLDAYDHVIESDLDLAKIAFEFKDELLGEENMSAYQFGKEAALEDLAERIDGGESFDSIMGSIQQTFGQEMDKTASEEDVRVRLGIEAVCYDFCKEASEVYGNGVEASEEDILLSVFERVIENNL